MGDHLAAYGLPQVGRVPRDHQVYKRHSVNGALGRLVGSEEHEELIGVGCPKRVTKWGHMGSRGPLNLLRCIRWGGCHVRH